jgi:uncharacterized SAM-binding protein YcdF (DUF218 family)
VIEAFVDFLKTFARPSSITVVIGFLALGAVLAWSKRTQRAVRWYLLGVFALFWILGTPACAERFVQWEGGGYQPLQSKAEARGASTVVILGAGNATIQARGFTINQVSWLAALRIIEGARLYHLLDRPTIIASGGITDKDRDARPEAEGMKTALVQLGVPADHVVLETESKNTHDEATIVARMLGARRSEPIVVVTSPTHMRRALAVFRSVGLDAIPSVAPYKSDHGFERLRGLPNDGGLLLSDIAIYDAMATIYYQLRGWAPR